jgi:phosphoglycerol transferase MdoB-like AlkP superfamily enzyme
MQEILRWTASLSTIGAGLVLAARVQPRTMGWAFVVLTAASVIWIVIGYLTAEYALMVQNAVVSLINVFGIYRWLIWKGKA